MKIEINKINPNPFKKHINDGKLDQDRIEILKESISHGTLPEHFFARKKDDDYELNFGHHRLEALRQVKGSDYQVEVTIVDFTDEQMLIDLVRENVTQRDTDYHDTREGIVLAREWLNSKVSDVKQFNNAVKGKKDFQPIKQPNSYRSIAEFLSKNGKAVSYVTVKNYLDVNDKLSPDLIPMIHKVGGGKAPEEVITVKQALALSKFEDPDEQKEILNAMKRMDKGRPHEFITAYKNAPDEIKEQVRKGEIDLYDVQDLTEIQKKTEGQDITEIKFIPNFKSQIKNFNLNVSKLEQQTTILTEFFGQQEFQMKYNTLNNHQKQNFDKILFDLKNRIKNCYDQVALFTEQIENLKLLEK